MPLAKDAGPIAGRSEQLGNRKFVAVHQRAAARRVNDARAIVIAPGEQASAGRRANRADVETFELHSLARKGIDVRSLEMRIAVNAKVGEPLVVGHHKDDIGAGGSLRRDASAAR